MHLSRASRSGFQGEIGGTSMDFSHESDAKMVRGQVTSSPQYSTVIWELEILGDFEMWIEPTKRMKKQWINHTI